MFSIVSFCTECIQITLLFLLTASFVLQQFLLYCVTVGKMNAEEVNCNSPDTNYKNVFDLCCHDVW